MTNPVFDAIRSFVLVAWAYPGVQFIVAGALANLALAIAGALHTGTFSMQVLGDFLIHQIAPWVLVYVVFSVSGDALGFGWVGPAVLALITAAMTSKILQNLTELGVAIPVPVQRVTSKPGDFVRLERIKPNSNK